VKEFLYPVRVYYEDTDSGGVVYYANYLKFMERTRTEMLRSFGFEQDELIREEGIIFAVRSISVEYLKPAKFNDLLQVSARLVEHGRASMTFEQHIFRKDNPAEPLCTGIVRIACLDADDLRPKPMPQSILMEISSER
jgi:acyl-CoA thioester hydrolase